MFKPLLSVFLKSRCTFCQRSTADILCAYCWQKLSSYQLSKSDRLKIYQAQATFAWGRYDGQLKRAIALMKYDNKPEIGNELGTFLGQAWLNSKLIRIQSTVTVVPIPLHPEKKQERGFNQAEIIAKGFCQVTRYKVNTQALIRIKQTKAMFDLESVEQRTKNLQGALKVGTYLPRHPVLLIDDIHTTGTTVKEAIKVLQQKKIEVVGVAVAAKAGLFR
jgi:ComF family protein